MTYTCQTGSGFLVQVPVLVTGFERIPASLGRPAVSVAEARVRRNLDFLLGTLAGELPAHRLGLAVGSDRLVVAQRQPEIGSSEIGTPKVGTPKVGILHVGAHQPSIAQVGVPELGPHEIGHKYPGILQVSARKVSVL